MLFRLQERLAIIIDGASLYATVVALGFEIDFLRLLALFRRQGRLVRALYYAVLAEEEQDGGLHQLLDWLAYNGFTVVTGPGGEATALAQRRGSRMHVALAVDALRLADHVDHVVLFTGDGDFRALVADIQRRGRRVSVASTVRMAADELRRQADQFIDLAELEPYIGRLQRRTISSLASPSAGDAAASERAREHTREHTRERTRRPEAARQTGADVGAAGSPVAPGERRS